MPQNRDYTATAGQEAIAAAQRLLRRAACALPAWLLLATILSPAQAPAQGQAQAQLEVQRQTQAEQSEPCDQRPVYMVVAGQTLDAQRMLAYGQAIRESGLYAQLGGYYVNVPRPVAVFEGDVPDNHVSLIVRFPCLANARSFWYSRVYQEQIRPLRLNPSAGDYTVTVYREGELPGYLQGAVNPADYQRPFAAGGVEQVPARTADTGAAGTP